MLEKNFNFNLKIGKDHLKYLKSFIETRKQRILNQIQYFLSPVTWRKDILVLFITGDLESRYFVYHLWHIELIS